MDHKNILSFYLKQLQFQIMINCIQGDQNKKIRKNNKRTSSNQDL